VETWLRAFGTDAAAGRSFQAPCDCA